MKSKEYYKVFLEASNLINEEWKRDIINARHSSYLISIDMTNEGLKVIDLIRDPNFKSSAWRQAGDRFSQLHNLRLTLQFSINIKDINYRYEFLNGVIKNIEFGKESSKTINLLFCLTYENPLLLRKLLIGLQYSRFFSNKKYDEIDFRLGINNNQWANKIRNQIKQLS